MKTLIFFITVTLPLVAFCQVSDPSFRREVYFENPEVNCLNITRRTEVFAPIGFLYQVVNSAKEIRFSYSIIDGFCQNRKFVPVTGGTQLYNGLFVSSNAGNLFNRISATNRLVDVWEDFSVILQDSIQLCYDKINEEVFRGTQNCTVDLENLPRQGVIVSSHKYNFTVNKKELAKLIRKKNVAKIYTTIEKSFRTQQSEMINMVVKISLAENKILIQSGQR